MTALCTVEDCKPHKPGCDRVECDCTPALAAAGSRVCEHHQDRPREQLRELPDFWVLLGEKPTTGATGKASEPAQPISDTRRNARSQMRAMLVTWCKILEEDRSVALPDERAIAAQTRQEAASATFDADVARDAWRARLGPENGAQSLTAYHRAQQRAALHRAHRETDRDIVEALREHIDRHLMWLLNSEHADQLVHDVDQAHRSARRYVQASNRAIRITCTCGEKVAIATEKGAIITCPGCGEWGTLDWWRQREAPPMAEGPQTLRDLPDVLFEQCGVVVGYDQLRTWRDRGLLKALPVDVEPGRPGALRYDVHTVALVAQARLRITQRRATA